MKRWHLPERGDTIVEVLISMVVLAIVAGTAYATSQRNFQAGLNSQQRDIATSFAQQQVELLKNAENNDGLSGVFDTGLDFCIKPSSPDTAAPISQCYLPFASDPSTANYNVTDKYISAKRQYLVTITWTSGNQPQQTSIIYKPKQSFVDTAGGSCPSCVSDIVKSPLSVIIDVYTDKTTVNYGDTVKVSWTTSSTIVSGTCTASSTDGNWSGPKSDNGNNESTDPLTNYSAGADFTLTCTGDDGQPHSGSAHVNVSPVPPDVSVAKANPIGASTATLRGKVKPNGFPLTDCTFFYSTSPIAASTTYPTTASSAPCTPDASSISKTSGSTNVSADLTGLGRGKTYYFELCAQNMFGPICSDSTLFSTANPPLAVSIDADSKNWTGTSSTTLRWSSSNVNGSTCNASGSWSGSVSANGDFSQSTGNLGPGSYTYSITCKGNDGTTQTKSVSITVNPPPLPPTCTIPGATSNRVNSTTVHITGSTTNCDAYSDSIVGPNGGFSIDISRSSDGFHTQCGIKSGVNVGCTFSDWR